MKTGRVVIAHEAPTNVSLGSEIAARISEHCFYSLEAPIIRVGGFNTPYPAAKLEEAYLPDADRILEAVDRVLAY
jgi:pyruvate dehydrogenase E1 component beta subunit